MARQAVLAVYAQLQVANQETARAFADRAAAAALIAATAAPATTRASPDPRSSSIMVIDDGL